MNEPLFARRKTARIFTERVDKKVVFGRIHAHIVPFSRIIFSAFLFNFPITKIIISKSAKKSNRLTTKI